MIGAEAGDEVGIDGGGFADRVLEFVFDHEGLSEIEADAQDVGAVGAGDAGEGSDELAEGLFGFDSLTEADVAEAEALLKGEASGLVEHGQSLGLIDGGLKLLGGGGCVVVDEGNHAAR